jgi:hypothetical protein
MILFYIHIKNIKPCCELTILKCLMSSLVRVALENNPKQPDTHLVQLKIWWLYRPSFNMNTGVCN